MLHVTPRRLPRFATAAGAAAGMGAVCRPNDQPDLLQQHIHGPNAVDSAYGKFILIGRCCLASRTVFGLCWLRATVLAVAFLLFLLLWTRLPSVPGLVNGSKKVRMRRAAARALTVRFTASRQSPCTAASVLGEPHVHFSVVSFNIHVSSWQFAIEMKKNSRAPWRALGPRSWGWVGRLSVVRVDRVLYRTVYGERK